MFWQARVKALRTICSPLAPGKKVAPSALTASMTSKPGSLKSGPGSAAEVILEVRLVHISERLVMVIDIVSFQGWELASRSTTYVLYNALHITLSHRQHESHMFPAGSCPIEHS